MLLAEDFAVDHGGDTHTLAAREAQRAANVGDDGLALRLLARFEQFFDARQTAGDVAGCLRRTAGVEGTERQLRARLADGLGGDDADCRADFDHFAATEVTTVAQRADAVNQRAGLRAANVDFGERAVLDGVGDFFVDHAVARDDQLARLRVIGVGGGAAPDDAFVHILTGYVVRAANPDAAFRAAVGTVDDHVLRHVHQTAGQITRVGGTQRRVRQTFTRAVRRDEVFQRGQALRGSGCGSAGR